MRNLHTSSESVVSPLARPERRSVRGACERDGEAGGGGAHATAGGVSRRWRALRPPPRRLGLLVSVPPRRTLYTKDDSFKGTFTDVGEICQ